MADGLWEVKDFLERFDDWVERDSVDDADLRQAVLTWMLTRIDDPYQGVSRDSSIPNLWYGKVPGTYNSKDRTAVMCSYFIDELTHAVRCDSFNVLGLPF